MSHVQTAGPNSPQTTTSLAIGTTGSGVATGNGVVGYGLVIVTSGTISISGIADDASNAYTVADTVLSGTTFFFQFYRVNITGLPHTITITFTGGTINTGLGQGYWEEFTDLSVGKSLDAHSLASVNTVTGTNGYKSTTLTTQNVSELAFASAQQLTGTATLTAGTTSTPPWTASLVDNGNQIYSEYLTKTSTSIQAVWTANNATSNFFLGVMTFGTLSVGGGGGKGGLFLIGIGSIGWTPSLIGAAALWKAGKAIRRNATLSRRSLLIGKSKHI